jgi:hypothetical protein
MDIIWPVLLLLLGILIVTMWAVNLIVTVVGYIIIVVAAVAIIRYLVGRRSRL